MSGEVYYSLKAEKISRNFETKKCRLFSRWFISQDCMKRPVKCSLFNLGYPMFKNGNGTDQSGFRRDLL